MKRIIILLMALPPLSFAATQSLQPMQISPTPTTVPTTTAPTTSIQSAPQKTTKNRRGERKVYLYVENQDTNVVECGINQLCDITLVQGDLFKSWIITDGSPWIDSVQAKMNYIDEKGNQHVVIQATTENQDNQTILIGTTHQYHFNLKSVQGLGSKKYVFVENQATALADAQIKDDGLKINENNPRNNKNYYIKGDTDADFKPVLIFNDGHKTYIKMPPSIDTTEKPVIQQFSTKGKLEDALCRYRKPYFVCDGLYKRLALVSGSDENDDQPTQRIDIYSGNKPTGMGWLFQQN